MVQINHPKKCSPPKKNNTEREKIKLNKYPLKCENMKSGVRKSNMAILYFFPKRLFHELVSILFMLTF